MSTMRLLEAVDGLYESVVSDPGAWNDQTFADWAGDVVNEPVDKQSLRAVRRALRAAEKLRRFWLDPPASGRSHDWRSRVDVALGPRAWRPTLDLAMAGLTVEPDAELYAEVQARFRLVYSDLWMEGITYEEWLAARDTKGAREVE
jgi:hypothetical protein